MLNLSWGDFVCFEKTTIPVLDAFEAWLQILPTFPLGRHRKTLYRAIGACPWLLVILLINVTHYLMHESTRLRQSACHVCVVAVGMIIFLMIITFFSFVPGFTFMTLSRTSRHEETGAALHCGEWAVVPGGAGRGVDGESADTSAKTGRGLRPEIAKLGQPLSDRRTAKGWGPKWRLWRTSDLGGMSLGGKLRFTSQRPRAEGDIERHSSLSALVLPHSG